MIVFAGEYCVRGLNCHSVCPWRNLAYLKLSAINTRLNAFVVPSEC